jgi:hypothetical protein
MYDQLADRFFVSQFGTAQNSLVLGVSTTNDPTGTYNVYEFGFDAFPDYPHYAIWPDGYYLTANKGGTNKVYVIERDVILAGGTNPQIVGFPLPGATQNTNTVLSPEPANLIGTSFVPDTPGYITYLQDDGWGGGVTFDHLKVWEIDVDWATIGNSSISSALEIPTAAFDSVFAPFGSGDADQPGTGQKIDMIGGIISFAANYRTFPGYNSWLITFNTDVDGNDTSGIRWIELRNDNVGDWEIFQEGTYAPADGHSRFMGSGAIDAQGNIGLAFNIASATLPVGIRYTGRFSDDDLGEMTVAETTIVDGVGVQTVSNRFGDYSHLTMDPDNFTFWHTAEYFTSNNNWSSRIASFNLSGGFMNDVAITDINTPNDGVLSNAESVEVVVRNFGSEDQSNFDVVLTLDGIVQATETFTGTLLASASATFTFTQTLNLDVQGQTYEIIAATALVNDEFTDNDAFTKNVQYTLEDDVGVVEITAPEAVTDLGNKVVTITVKNFGGNTQSNFDVQYTIDGAGVVVENFIGPLATNEELSFSFVVEADLTSAGTYVLEAKTNLVADQNTVNDAATLTVQTNACTPTAENGCNVDGIKRFILADIDADDGQDGCNTEPAAGPEGYADRTNLSTILSNQSGSNVYNLQAQTNWDGGVGVEVLSAWIDFNDNLIFEPSEQLIAGETFQVVDALDDFELVIPTGSALGAHVLRVRALDGSASGDINDPCGNYAFGETHDYTVIIDDFLGGEDQQLIDSDLIVLSNGSNVFDITLTTPVEGQVFIAVYNSLGQLLKYKPVARNGNSFNLTLNMNATSSGVYFVKMISMNENSAKTAKIIVE